MFTLTPQAYLFLGYGAAFVLVLVYVLHLAGRLRRLEAEFRRSGSFEDGGTVP
ncbi:MAG TPA: CcmD family protein [Bacillota bacterium]